MIGKKDLETEAGNTEFGEYCKSVERFARSKGFSQEDAEDIAQETGKRVCEKLDKDENLRVNGGYFIETAKYVLREKRREYAIRAKYFFSASENEEGKTEQTDIKKTIAVFKDEKERAIITDCMVECFEERSEEEQLLLWRYSFDEKFALELEEPDSYRNLFATILDSIREIRSKFVSLQEEFSPITEDLRLRVFRLRKKLKICVENCIARKKGVV